MKINRLIFSLVLLMLGWVVSAQEVDFDAYMERKVKFRCEDISETSSLLFCDYVKRSDLDSAAMLLSYWNDRCHDNEAVERAKILLSIKNGTYSDDSLSFGVTWDMMEFKRRLVEERGDYYEEKPPFLYYSYLDPGCEFDLFTREWAAEMMVEQDENSIEYLWCQFFSGETSGTLRAISEMDKSAASFLVNETQKMIKEVGSREQAFNMAFLSGMWMPVGELSVFGIHPEIGFQVGGQDGRFMLDFTLLFRFADTKKPYAYKRYIRESWGGYVSRQSNSFRGTYLGLDFGYVAYKKKRSQVDVLAGLAYDAITEIGLDDDYNERPEDIYDRAGFWDYRSASYNLNIGIGYRYFISKDLYLGVKAKYNFVDYSDRHLIDYKGYPVTVHFTFGGLFANREKQEKRKWINY